MIAPTASAEETGRETYASIDGQRQQTARAYARTRYVLSFGNLALSFVLVLAFLLSGASLRLEQILAEITLLQTGGWAVLTALYIIVVFLAFSIIMLPLSWWGGFVIPHRFGLSTQTRQGWWVDELKSGLLGLVFGVPVALIVYWFLRQHPSDWWIWAGAVMIGLGILFDYLAPILFLPIFYKLTPLADAGLIQRISDLAQKTGTRIAGVYTLNLSSRTRAANAMVMGLGRTKRIALGDTLYQAFSADEIETVIAHELGHQVQRDLEVGTVLQSVFTLAGLFVADRFLGWGVARFGFAGPGDVANLPLLALAGAIFSLLTMPLGNAFSRWRESRADAYALRVTQKPLAFASAMARLANQNLSQVDPPRLAVWLLFTHPPIAERIAMAQRQAKLHGRTDFWPA